MAVDEATKKYFKQLYGDEIGEALTRDIPTRTKKELKKRGHGEFDDVSVFGCGKTTGGVRVEGLATRASDGCRVAFAVTLSKDGEFGSDFEIHGKGLK